MEDLEKYFEKTNTCPTIRQALPQALKNWRKQQPQNWDQQDSETLLALQHQSSIGWQDLLEGLSAKQWGIIQQYHYNLIDDQRTGKKWLVGLTKLLIQAGQKQWQHRNDYKHHTGKPRHKRMVDRLNNEITLEYAKGTATLLPGDKRKLNINLVHLLERSLPYKQS